jgi:hypothetical protein
LRSVTERQMLSAKVIRCIHLIWEYHLYASFRVCGDKTEHCGDPASMYQGADISPSTETLDFL